MAVAGDIIALPFNSIPYTLDNNTCVWYMLGEQIEVAAHLVRLHHALVVIVLAGKAQQLQPGKAVAAFM